LRLKHSIRNSISTAANLNSAEQSEQENKRESSSDSVERTDEEDLILTSKEEKEKKEKVVRIRNDADNDQYLDKEYYRNTKTAG
jgi:hypothetical protein